jgi:hypothetical protein
LVSLLNRYAINNCEERNVEKSHTCLPFVARSVQFVKKFVPPPRINAINIGFLYSAIVGELDENLDSRLDLSSIRADPLNHVVH